MTGAADPLPRPGPYLVRDNALPADQVAELLAFALTHEAAFEASKVGADMPADYRRSRALPRALFDAWRPRMEAWIDGLMPGIFADLGMAPFAMARLELELVASNDGDRLLPHIDTRIGVNGPYGPRLVSMVFYFHRAPKSFDGGALRISSLTSSLFVDIMPEQNRLVAFPSFVPHEVLSTSCRSRQFEDSRFSINLFARAKKAARGGGRTQ